MRITIGRPFGGCDHAMRSDHNNCGVLRSCGQRSRSGAHEPSLRSGYGRSRRSRDGRSRCRSGWRAGGRSARRGGWCAVTGTVGALGTAAGAVAGGPLVVNVAPGGGPAPVGVPVVINGVAYDRVPVRALFTTGPRYPERSGVRVGRGSVIPEWIDTAPMRNVSIRRLRPGAGYGYFVSPDNKVVVINPGSRRIARVISRAG